MTKHYAELTRTVIDRCTFESTDCQTGKKIEEYTVRIGLNAALLMMLAEALGSDTLALEIGGPLNAVKVTPSSPTDERFGLIMPVKI